MQFLKFLGPVLVGLITLFAFSAIAANLNTSGRCPSGTTCDIDGSKSTAIVLKPDDDVQIINSATGSVILEFRDYADTADDDMAHAVITVNCTTATTGAEDCNLTIGVVEAGAAAETRFSIDADGGVGIGSANTNQVTVTTDGGAVTIDGSVRADVPFLVVTTAVTLTANTVHIATTDATTHIMPACVAANLGEWITVVVGDVSEAISLSLADASNRFVVSGVDISAAAHELDSPTAAATSGGASVTLTCLVAEFWHSTAITGVWLDGN